MVDYSKVVGAAEDLLEYAEEVVSVPYVAGGMSLTGMDCQGLVEFVLAECGLKRNWKGSNDMWRNALKWSGAPEEAVERFGSLPAGAGVFILSDDGGEPDSYKKSDIERFGRSMGNASHVGLWLGNGRVVHASASRGCVCESTNFDGRKAVPNGGWNMVGLWADVMYPDAVERELMNGGSGASGIAGVAADDGVCDSITSVEGLTAGTPQAKSPYATVHTPDGNPVKMRKTASRLERQYWHVNPSARVRIERSKGDWSLITAVCTDGIVRRGYMMRKFLNNIG